MRPSVSEPLDGGSAFGGVTVQPVTLGAIGINPKVSQCSGIKFFGCVVGSLGVAHGSLLDIRLLLAIAKQKNFIAKVRSHGVSLGGFAGGGMSFK